MRFIGVDTLEISHGKEAAQPLGPEAVAFTKKNLSNQDVSLEFDAEKKDKYGRLLAYVYLPNGTIFDETLLREGYVQVATFPPNTRYWTASRRRKKRLERPSAASGAYRRANNASCGTGGTGSAVARRSAKFRARWPTGHRRRRSLWSGSMGRIGRRTLSGDGA